MDRKSYRMSEQDHEELLDAGKPVMQIMLHVGGGPPSPQENANRAWAALGEKLGFKSMTVRPDGSDSRNFTAEPVEAETPADV